MSTTSTDLLAPPVSTVNPSSQPVSAQTLSPNQLTRAQAQIHTFNQPLTQQALLSVTKPSLDAEFAAFMAKFPEYAEGIAKSQKVNQRKLQQEIKKAPSAPPQLDSLKPETAIEQGYVHSVDLTACVLQ